MRARIIVFGVAFVLLLWGALAGPAALEAQGPEGRWPLQPNSPGNRTLAPFMEGWYENEDGTYSISFGYLNANQDTLVIPMGEGNFLDPAEFNGMQPTTFYPGHHRGVFAVTVPAVMKDQDVWWTLRKENGEVTKVPGRIGAAAYQLDWNVRPHGTVPPRVSFDSQHGEGRGPPGIVAARTLTVSTGSPLTVSINIREASERDRTDFRFFDALTLRVVWSKHQGPGEVKFTRHESTPVPEEADTPNLSGGGGSQGARRPGPETITVPDDLQSTVRVVATFSEPGGYILRAQVDNFRALDSSSGDQCCWTNGYVRVEVSR